MGLVLIVLVCVCAAIAVGGGLAQGEEQNALTAKALNQDAAAKRPDAFSRLFKEEFPEFADQISFVKSESMIRAYTAYGGSSQHKKHLHWLYTKNYKSDDAELQAKRELLEHCAPCVSPEFCDYALSDVLNVSEKIIGIFTSSATLSRSRS